MDGNQYAKLFENKAYFSKVYPMYSKRKSGYYLKLFCREFGVPENLTVDGFKNQSCKGNMFMTQFRKQCIDYEISEPELPNHNMVEGVIMEVRRKCYRTIVKKKVPSQLWDFGLIWISEVISMSHSSANSVNGGTSLTKATCKIVDISK